MRYQKHTMNKPTQHKDPSRLCAAQGASTTGSPRGHRCKAHKVHSSSTLAKRFCTSITTSSMLASR